MVSKDLREAGRKGSFSPRLHQIPKKKTPSGVFFCAWGFGVREPQNQISPLPCRAFPKDTPNACFPLQSFFSVLGSVGRCSSTTSFDRLMTTIHTVLPMAAVCGAPRVRRFGLHRSVNPYTAATTCLTASDFVLLLQRYQIDHRNLAVLPEAQQLVVSNLKELKPWLLND